MDSLGPEFDAFVREGSTALLRTAYLLVGDRGHAEDLVQTALLRTARRWRHASPDPTAYARRCWSTSPRTGGAIARDARGK